MYLSQAEAMLCRGCLLIQLQWTTSVDNLSGSRLRLVAISAVASGDEVSVPETYDEYR